MNKARNTLPGQTFVFDNNVFLTPDELTARWKGHISVRALQNWRHQRKGPKFTKLGKGPRARVLYRLSDVVEYEEKQTKGA